MWAHLNFESTLWAFSRQSCQLQKVDFRAVTFTQRAQQPGWVSILGLIRNSA